MNILTCFHQIFTIYEKLTSSVKKNITIPKAKEQVENFVKAKTKPFSPSKDLSQKITQAGKDYNRRKFLIIKQKQELKEVYHTIKYIQNQKKCNRLSSSAIGFLYEKKANLENQINNLSKKKQASVRQIKHLNQVKSAQMQAQLRPYISAASDLMIPGTSVIVGTMITVGSTIRQAISARKLSNTETERQEHAEVCHNIYVITAMTTASCIFSNIMMPLFKRA